MTLDGIIREGLGLGGIRLDCVIPETRSIFPCSNTTIASLIWKSHDPSIRLQPQSKILGHFEIGGPELGAHEKQKKRRQDDN